MRPVQLNNAIRVMLASVLLLLAARRASAQPAPPVMSVDEVRKLHDAGQYRSALQEAARALRASMNNKQDAPPAWPDMYELQWLRGDSLLHLEELRDLIDYLGQIRTITERGLQLARLHRGNAGAWEQLANDTSNIQRHASDVLMAE